MALCKTSLKTVLIDLSGTLHIENTITAGAIEALNKLRDTNVRVKFVTNTTKESRRCLHERLTDLGFAIRPDEIWSSLWVARDVVASRGLRPLLLVDDAAVEDFAGARSEGEHDSVVVGLAPDKFNYAQLNKAFRVLLSGAPLIAIHEGRYYKRLDGLALGPGPFVRALEYATGCKAEVVGKPSAAFFESALGGFRPEEAVMIGDDVKDDVDGAQRVGIRGILVKTGKYREGDEAKISPAPSQVCADFAQAVAVLLEELQ
ncbi:haloacid dehalogenase-like hydrolase domain-containing protein 2 [Bacillus rossius redtenbacheri]|uniref:haloacid dehalogenase-like hydrolase domain-containing protein 2 n=1 Tax=Bacillus rossius redtenbacheri TaxID=93214 RepID=UPI002FDD1767